MNDIQSRLRLLAVAFVGAMMVLLSGAALADPPTRVARLSFLSGPVSFSPAGEDEWVLAAPNRPLITGDRLWADAGGRAELQAGSVALRLGASTSVNVLNLDDRTTQMELAQGSLYVRVWRLDRDEAVEIDTPNLAFTITSAGRYRIDVDPEGNVTTLAVLAGQGEAYGEGAGYRIGAGERYSFSGTGLRDYEYSDIGPADEFDRWAADRDRRYDTSLSARYVSRDVIGYQDLDQYGTWSVVADYGNVWYPRSIPSGWAPYRTGQWAWIDPWGWTWIDDAPWGFAPYHYGRWAYVTGRWGWIPGPVNVRPIYAPALVAFIGGGDFRLSLSVGGAASGVAWFPLGPGEVYQPAYRVSRDYFTNVNISNTRVTNVNITNVYNNYTTNTTVTNVTYRNRQAPGAVTAVPTTAFVQSQPVARAAVQVPREVMAQQAVSAVARVAPTRASIVSAAAQASAASAAKPPARTLQREVVARNKPPAPPAAFASPAGRARGKSRQADRARRSPGAARAREHRSGKECEDGRPDPGGRAGAEGRGAPCARAAWQGRRAGRAASGSGGSSTCRYGPASHSARPANRAGAYGNAPDWRAAARGRGCASRARERATPGRATKGVTTEAPPPTGAGQATPVPRPPQDRRTGRPPETPVPTGRPEASKGTTQPPQAAPQPAPQAQPRGPEPKREAPPRAPEARREAAPPQAAPQPAPQVQQRGPEPKREAPPRPPETRQAPTPPPAPAAQPQRPEPKRAAPKAEPKREEGKDKNKEKDKDQKDKDQKGKGSEG